MELCLCNIGNTHTTVCIWNGEAMEELFTVETGKFKPEMLPADLPVAAASVVQGPHPTSGPPLRLSLTPRREISRSQEAGGRRWTVSFRAVAICRVKEKKVSGAYKHQLPPGGTFSIRSENPWP